MRSTSSQHGPVAVASALLAFAAIAHAQLAPVPPAVAASPWARAYRACAEQALLRHAADGLKPLETVTLAERDCAGKLPVPGIGVDPASFGLVVANEHRDLMNHFGPATTLVYSVPASTIAVGGGATCPRPEYPPAAVRSGAMGTSRVRLTIAQDGSVSDGQLVGASGPTREHALLDSQAVASFRQCRFPADPDHPPRQTTLDYVWRLE